MSKNDRKSIEKCRKKLSQFTTMNVIDGQAGLIIYTSLIFYSLTIDNILNIIVLLILAGISIATLTGENGLLKNAINAKQQTEESEAKEKIEMEIANLIIKKSEELKKATIDDLIEHLQGNDDIAIKKESDTSAIIGTDGYAFRIDENLKIIEKVSIALLSDIEMTYIINSTNGNTRDITITASVSSGMERIITPDGDKITPEDTAQTKLTIDYKINLGEEYRFKLQIKGEEELKEYILIMNENDKPIINQSESYSYPTITKYGILENKKVTIDYGEATERYYSLDNGETWQKYTEEIDIDKDCTLMAKAQKEENRIQRIDKKEIKMNLASDALGIEAYDKIESSSVQLTGSKQAKIEIDPNMWERIICLTADFTCSWAEDNNQWIYFVNTSGVTTLYKEFKNNGLTTIKYNKEKITIPENTKYIMFKSGARTTDGHGIKIYEIKY